MNMIEKVARAICAAKGGDPDRLHQDYGATTTVQREWHEWTEHTEVARAAIEAMREPTEEMVNSTPEGLVALPSWEAMITAALEGK